MNRFFAPVRIVFVLSVLYTLAGCVSNNSTSVSVPPPDDSGYPRLAMWWPSTSQQPVEQLMRYDWIGFGIWDDINTINTLKSRNPNQKHFMDYSITETSWSWWQNDRKSTMKKIPAQWFLTQYGANLTQPVNDTQTIIDVTAVTDSHGDPLFAVDDNIVCGNETMKVTGIDITGKQLVVERGFVRSATSHEAGTRIAAHITFWPTTWVMNMSSMCPKIDIGDGNGPQTWVEYACRTKNIENQELWDGYIVDRIEKDQSWLTSRWCRNIDGDCSNNEVSDNYAAFDAAWNQGCSDFLEFMRTLFPGKALISNTSGAYYQSLNGAIYESFPGNWVNSKPETYEDWAQRALDDNGYIHVSSSGHSPNYSLAETYEDEEMPEGGLEYDNPFDHADFVPNYQRMRYGLTTALLGDGYFSYEISTNGHGSLGLMWFDEYDNAGKQRGYLGKPTAKAVAIMPAGDGQVWKRVYEKGVVICNPTNSQVNIELGSKYYLINGSQVPEVNSGAQVESVTIGPLDGRILLIGN